jgi:hypothetical protein
MEGGKRFVAPAVVVVDDGDVIESLGGGRVMMGWIEGERVEWKVGGFFFLWRVTWLAGRQATATDKRSSSWRTLSTTTTTLDFNWR